MSFQKAKAVWLQYYRPAISARQSDTHAAGSQVQGEPRLYNKTLSQKTKEGKKGDKRQREENYKGGEGEIGDEDKWLFYQEC